jgi:YVTN family beta-propeller protein
VRVLDPATYATLAEIPVGVSPRALGIFSSIPRTRIYAANGGSASVSVIDGASRSVIATVPTGAKPRAIAVDPATGWAWVTSESSNTVTVIDDTDSLRATIPVGAVPRGIAIDSAGGRVFVANWGSGTVSVLRTATLDSEATLTVGANPLSVAFDSGDRKAFVTCFGSDQVAVIDSTLTVTPIAVGDGPQSVAVNQTLTPHEAYVTNYLGHTLSVIDEPLAAPVAVARFGPAGMGMAALQVAAATPPATVTVTSSVRDKASGLTTVTGTVSSTRRYPAAILALKVRVDGAGPWIPVQQVTGLGSASATWTIGLGSLVAGTHTLEFDVLDQTSAVAQSADAGITGGSVDSAGIASASFTTASSSPPRGRHGRRGTIPIVQRGRWLARYPVR